MTLTVRPGLTIAEDELHETFVLSSGPGGQNVNKVASAVQLRFDVRGSPSLPEAVRARVLALRDRRLTRDGVLVLTARGERSQDANRAEARARLAAIIARAATPVAKRRPTRPTFSSQQKRLESKAKRARVKRERGRVSEGSG
jgi:ribosome-associated protein